MKLKRIFTLLLTVMAFAPVEGADITVTSAADSGAGSLREAISIAAPGDTIRFDSSFASGSKILLNGELTVNQDLIIVGPGPDLLALDGQGQSRVFNLGNKKITITDLTITNGFAPVQGSVGAPSFAGGGIQAYTKTLFLSNCWLVGNRAGPLPTDACPAGGYDCSKATAYGGAIWSDSGGTLTIDSCIISNNSANGGGAPLIVSCTTISFPPALGGGVYWGGQSLKPATFKNTTLADNTARGSEVGGGGLFIQIGSDIENCTVSGNHLIRTGPTPWPPPGCTNPSELPPVPPAAGGGIYALSFSSIHHCTIVSNTVVNNPGVVNPDPETPNRGGGVAGHLSLRNTIVAGNEAASEPDVACLGLPDFVVSLGHNFVGRSFEFPEPEPGASGDQVGRFTSIDPKLGALQNNGGPTPTHALLASSPSSTAINAGDDAAAPEFDQRGAGFPRIQFGQIDIGAFESSVLAPLRLDCPPNKTIPTFPGEEDNISLPLHSFVPAQPELGMPVISGGMGSRTVTLRIDGGDLITNPDPDSFSPALFDIRTHTLEWSVVDDTVTVPVICSHTIMVVRGNLKPDLNGTLPDLLTFTQQGGIPCGGGGTGYTSPAFPANLFTDPEGGSITYSASVPAPLGDSPCGITLHPASRTFRGGITSTPEEYSVTVTATDNGTPPANEFTTFIWRVVEGRLLTVREAEEAGRFRLPAISPQRALITARAPRPVVLEISSRIRPPISLR
jgi:hypothetical protein